MIITIIFAIKISKNTRNLTLKRLKRNDYDETRFAAYLTVRCYVICK